MDVIPDVISDVIPRFVSKCFFRASNLRSEMLHSSDASELTLKSSEKTPTSPTSTKTPEISGAEEPHPSLPSKGILQTPQYYQFKSKGIMQNPDIEEIFCTENEKSIHIHLRISLASELQAVFQNISEDCMVIGLPDASMSKQLEQKN